MKLRSEIIAHMKSTPYIDSQNRVYEYGEFFPAELSPFAYNETVASDYMPLSKQDTLAQGLLWKDPEEKQYTTTMTLDMIPDDITTVGDSILNEIIECRHKGECRDRCTSAFRITKDELIFYKRFSIPLPDLCYRCRHYERFHSRNPLKLWHRRCMCELPTHQHHGACGNEFETSYAPDRPEKVFCEKCYVAEIM